jgi:hypothetical protein
LLIAIAVLLSAAVVWCAGSRASFGGRYRHAESNSVYEFRGGRFYENGKDLGSYSVGLRSVEIKFDHIDAVADGRLGWNTVVMPLPKYGDSVLVKSE